MSRIQLALNVHDLDSSVAYYSKMFATSPVKVRPGYANFAISDPPLKLVLFENPDSPVDSDFHHLNHLGVETESADQVIAAESRLSAEGFTTTGVDDTVCCYADKTETWIESPDGAKWEWYVKNGDAGTIEHSVTTGRLVETEPAGHCC